MRFKAALLYLIALLLILGGTLSSCGALADDKQSNLPPVVVFESETGNALITATVRSAQFFDDWRGVWQGRPYLGTEVTLQLDDTQVLAGDFGVPESLQITVVAKNVADIPLNNRIYMILYVFERPGSAAGGALTLYHGLYWGDINTGICVPEKDFMTTAMQAQFSYEHTLKQFCLSQR